MPSTRSRVKISSSFFAMPTATRFAARAPRAPRRPRTAGPCRRRSGSDPETARRARAPCGSAAARPRAWTRSRRGCGWAWTAIGSDRLDPVGRRASACERPGFELAVFAAPHPAVFADDHRRDRFAALDRRDVEALDPARKRRQRQHGAQRFERLEVRRDGFAEARLVGHCALRAARSSRPRLSPRFGTTMRTRAPADRSASLDASRVSAARARPARGSPAAPAGRRRTAAAPPAGSPLPRSPHSATSPSPPRELAASVRRSAPPARRSSIRSTTRPPRTWNTWTTAPAGPTLMPNASRSPSGGGHLLLPVAERLDRAHRVAQLRRLLEPLVAAPRRPSRPQVRDQLVVAPLEEQPRVLRPPTAYVSSLQISARTARCSG